jgi:hypothetical protein
VHSTESTELADDQRSTELAESTEYQPWNWAVSRKVAVSTEDQPWNWAASRKVAVSCPQLVEETCVVTCVVTCVMTVEETWVVNLL